MSSMNTRAGRQYRPGMQDEMRCRRVDKEGPVSGRAHVRVWRRCETTEGNGEGRVQGQLRFTLSRVLQTLLADRMNKERWRCMLTLCSIDCRVLVDSPGDCLVAVGCNQVRVREMWGQEICCQVDRGWVSGRDPKGTRTIVYLDAMQADTMERW